MTENVQLMLFLALNFFVPCLKFWGQSQFHYNQHARSTKITPYPHATQKSSLIAFIIFGALLF